jgi:2-desacetyl-2-hydroxyethyl bacteriochlorophyllide A dehydrogenase
VESLSLWFTAPEKAELKASRLLPPEKNEILVKALFSGVSAGTERLVYRGEATAEDTWDTSLPTVEGSFYFPLKYGYSNVGEVLACGKEVVKFKPGDKVFVLAPHQSHYVIRQEWANPLKESISPEKGVFLANLETAINCLLDAEFHLGENVVIFGQGVVGLLLTQLFRLAGAEKVITVEKEAKKQGVSLKVGADYCFSPEDKSFLSQIRNLTKGKGVDLAVEASGTPEALDLALKTVAFQGTVLVVSWYGNKPVTCYLGKEFHRKRLNIKCSQVSNLNPALVYRWDKKRRMALAQDLLPRLKLEELISHIYPFKNAPAVFQEINRHPEEFIQVIFKYF